MGIDTNLNQSPYFDDFNEDDNYHRVLFKPAVAVQARELTQLQTILQSQVERFGENILYEGTIIKGGNFTDIKRYNYVKIEDNNTEGQPVAINNYLNLFASGQTTGVIAKITFVVGGLESQTPDLNTFYVNYLKTNGSNKKFQAGEVLDLYTTYTSRTLSGRYTEELQNGTSINVSVTVPTTDIDSNPVGVGYATKVDDGIVFQKGHFIRFDPQSVIVSKYTNTPDGIVVGFKTKESLITSSNDPELLDNANGFNNYNAPGADRLKLEPQLVAYTLAQAEADENFFAILEYDNGRLVRRNNTTQFNSIGSEMARRTAEESGNYEIDPFRIHVRANTANTDLFDVVLSKGLAYVEGKRIETIGASRFSLRQGTDFENVESQDILANYGNYLVVNDMVGSFDFDPPETIDLYGTAQNATTLAGFSASGTKIGEAKVRQVTRQPGSTTQYRIYLFDIIMNSGRNFRDVKSLVQGTVAVADVILTNNQAKVTDRAFESLVFPIGNAAIKSVSQGEYTYRVKESLTANSSGEAVITPPSGTTFPYTGVLNSDQEEDFMVVVTDGTNRPSGVEQGEIVPVTQVDASDGSSAVVSIDGTGLSTTCSVDIYYNVKKTNVNPSGKTLETVYIKVDGSAYPNFARGNISLGLPDVFEIEGIWKGTDYSESNTDVTNRFRLYRNDTLTHYGLSYIKKSRRLSLTTSHKLLIKCRVFRKTTSGSYDQSYFTVNSYPIDDANTANTSAITTEEIPELNVSWKQSLNLRDTIDFRPYAANTVAYATTIGAATVRGAGDDIGTERRALDFGTTDLLLIAPNENVEVDYDYYQGRVDKIIMDPEGRFVSLEGDAEDDPQPPSDPDRGMTLASVFIPPYPSLTWREAANAKKREHQIKLKRESAPVYRMSDIEGIEKRVDRLEYYTALNALELSAKDLKVTDADGNDRFKNGILVDTFENLAIANVRDDTFAAGVDRAKKELTPKFRKYTLDLEIASKTNTVHTRDGLTLPYNQKRFITQPYASNFKNCVTNFYNYKGQMAIYPQYDSAADVTRAPDVNFDIDLTTPFVEFTDALSQFVDLSFEDQQTLVTTTAAGTTTTTTTTNTSLNVSNGRSQTQAVGDFVSDVSFNPFMRGRVIRVAMNGLRPNTEMHFFFDEVNVDAHICKAEWAVDDDDNEIYEIDQITRNGRKGVGPFVSDDNGELQVMFALPDGQFTVGDKKLIAMDVDSLASADAVTTSSDAIYSAFNFSYEKTNLQISTRQPQITVDEDESIQSTFQPAPPAPTGGGGGGKDPIAQTFQINPDMSSDHALQLTKVDLYFEKKSQNNNGVTVMIRTTQNGYPGRNVLPFSVVHLNNNQINVSADGSVKTTIVFKSPVTVRTDMEYAIVVMPDANDPDFRVWVAKTGLEDLFTGVRITQDANPGTLFTSTNNTAWTPYQDENMKFRLFKADYTQASGNVTFTNKDTEFFTCNAYSGTFQRGEEVYVDSANAAGTISSSGRVINGSGTTFTSLFNVGEHILYFIDANTVEVAKIKRITNDTRMVIDKRPSSTLSGDNYFKTVTGEVDFWSTDDPVRLVLEKSSAKSGLKFTAGDTVKGTDSGALAVIESVDDVAIAKMQPNIYRNNFGKTNTKLRVTKLLNSADTDYTGAGFKTPFNRRLDLNRQQTFVKSKSNEITDGTGNSFEARVDLQNTSNTTKDTSPIIDHDISNMSIVEYIVNNDITNENTNQEGDADCKYISRTVELQEELDAADLKLWLTGYRPSGSDIHVYAKFKNSDDTTELENIPWTKMDRLGRSNFTSSSRNLEDFKEFEYYIPAGTASTGNGARIDSGAFKYISEEGVEFNDYKYFAIKIVLTTNGQHRIPRVRDYRALALT